MAQLFASRSAKDWIKRFVAARFQLSSRVLFPGISSSSYKIRTCGSDYPIIQIRQIAKTLMVLRVEIESTASQPGKVHTLLQTVNEVESTVCFTGQSMY